MNMYTMIYKKTYVFIVFNLFIKTNYKKELLKKIIFFKALSFVTSGDRRRNLT